MGRNEVEPYVIHRLKQVGWSGNPHFESGVFVQLHAASGGIPRRINQIANRLLLLGAVEQRTRIDEIMLRSVLEEMETERAYDEGRIKPAVAPPPAAATPSPKPEPAQAPVDTLAITQLLAERDAQIAELQQAVVELAAQADAVSGAAVHPEIETLTAQVARLEARIFDQERAIRQTLTMLIEWIEGEMEQTKAA